jgi:para-aminobenzoate synthetase/4-amino-4-deoxychorismate lyase
MAKGMAPAPPDPSLGVFETLLVRDGRVQALDAHADRLAASVAELYGLELPAGFHAGIAQRGSALSGEHRLRVDAIPDAAGLRIDVQTTPLAPAGLGRAALVCRTVLVPGGLGRHKWSDRRRLDALDALIALGDVRVVPLLADRGGDLLEAAWANLWLLEGTRLVTPPADGRLLPGVTRAMLLELAPALGFEARQEPISLTRARAADQAFLTSSLRLAVGARLVDSSTTGEDPHPAAAQHSSAAGQTLEAIRAALSRAGWARDQPPSPWAP